ncbi:site-specific integrase [Ruminococcus sp.]|uniref:tyrosine-type recombinase/integrase n=1 Tax=Ruminococcus sp. TaxID=41978 RepID=UPI0025E4565C|nr:site-specific integrase [Ruminococcus sp.]
MNIQERKNKDGKITSYRIRVFDHRDTDTGKQVFRNLSIKYDSSKSESWNRKNAEKQAAIFEKGIEEQTLTDSRIAFAEYAEYAISIKEKSDITEGTAIAYRQVLKSIEKYIGHIQLKNLVPNVLNKLYSELLKNGKSKKHVRYIHSVIRIILAFATKEGIIPKNYAAYATPPKKEKSVVNALTEEETQNFFKALYSEGTNYTYQVLFSLMIATGCRIGEICSLSWEDVDFSNKRVHICKHYVQTKAGYVIKEGCKTSSGVRWIYLDDSTMNMLSDYYNDYKKKLINNGGEWNMDKKAVFTSPSYFGEHLKVDAARSWLTYFNETHGLPHFRPHQLRHTSISLQIKAGIALTDVAKRAGHSRSDTTLMYYAHSMTENNRHCCEAVTKILPDKPESKGA